MMKQINFRRRQSQLSPIQKATLRNVAFIVSFCLFCSLLNSEIWEIKQDGSGDFTTVQQGIDAAVNGDTVLVYPGTYYENLVIL